MDLMPFQNANRLLHIVHRTLKKTINDKRLTINKPAFTLIELLVVIAIIGILASLATYSYTDSQKKSRDSRRKSDLVAIQKALELAKQDSAGNYSYPSCRTYVGVGCRLIDDTAAANGGTNPDLIGSNFSYIKSIPVDPKIVDASADTEYYWYAPTGLVASCAVGTCTGFSLVACLENSKDPQKDEAQSGSSNNLTACPNSGTTAGTKSYTLTNL